MCPEWNWTKNGPNWNANMITIYKIHARIQCIPRSGQFSTIEASAISLPVILIYIQSYTYIFAVFIWLEVGNSLKSKISILCFGHTVNADPNTFDFAKHWQKYWSQRVQVYFNKSRQKITEEIAANYQGTVFHGDDSDASSNDETSNTSRSVSSRSVSRSKTSSTSSSSDVFDLTSATSSNAPSNGRHNLCSQFFPLFSTTKLCANFIAFCKIAINHFV